MGKKYKCPYCELRAERKDLIMHVEEEHDDMIPKNYTSSRVVYNQINKREHGTCMICKKETKWDEDKQRYDSLCDSKRCHDEYVKMVRSRMIHKYGTDNLLKDPKFQQKMLANRKISGKYKFKDGGYVGYVGGYEKKFLEFLDKFLNVKSYDIISPGPTIPYTYKGKQHYWITDFLYEPYNLVFDIKDGGDNPNTRDMKEYREKQIAKEKAIQEYEDYNYIRLTDNKFEQLITIMILLKEKEDQKPLIQINESYIEESIKTYTAIKSFFGMLNPKTWGNSPIYNGNFESIHGKLLSYVKRCKTKSDIDYLRKDLSQAKTQLNKIKTILKYAIDNPNDNKQQYQEMRKRMKKGLSIKKIDNHLKWIDEVYRPALSERLKEITSKSSTNESTNIDNEDFINTIIFDFGGVLIEGNFEYCVRNSNKIPQVFADKLIEVWLSVANSDFDETISKEEFLEMVKEKLEQIHHCYIEELANISINCLHLTERALEIIRGYKQLGYKVYYLSNWDRWSMDKLRNHSFFQNFLNLFDGGIFSYETGLKKPDKRIYQLLLDKYQIDPHKALFYDDKKENINAARSVGLNAEIFDAKHAIEQIQGTGVKLAGDKDYVE